MKLSLIELFVKRRISFSSGGGLKSGSGSASMNSGRSRVMSLAVMKFMVSFRFGRVKLLNQVKGRSYSASVTSLHLGSLKQVKLVGLWVLTFRIEVWNVSLTKAGDIL